MGKYKKLIMSRLQGYSLSLMSGPENEFVYTVTRKKELC